MLKERSKLSKDKILSKSKSISEKLYNLKLYKESNFIFSFISFKDEVNTHDIIKTSLDKGKRVGVPITIPKTRIMKVSELIDFDKELALGFYNILAPLEEYERIISPEIIDLVLVPGLAFNRKGYRVGYGGGYYDSFFARMKRPAIKIGICFDMQLIEKAPVGYYDVPVDYILTENEFIKC